MGVRDRGHEIAIVSSLVAHTWVQGWRLRVSGSGCRVYTVDTHTVSSTHTHQHSHNTHTHGTHQVCWSVVYTHGTHVQHNQSRPHPDPHPPTLHARPCIPIP